MLSIVVFVIRYSDDGIWRRGLSTIINFVTMREYLDRNSGTPIPKNKKGVPRQMQSRLRPCSNLSKNLQVKKSGDAISMAGENVHPLGSNSPTCAGAQTLVSPIPIRTSPDFLTAPKEPIPKSFSGVLPKFLRSFSGSFPGGSPDNFPVQFHTHGSHSGL